MTQPPDPYGARPPPGQSPPPPPGDQPPPWGQPPYPPPQPGYNVIAILAFIFAFVFAPVGIVLGIVARRQIRDTGERGSGLATAGLVLGIIFTGLAVIGCCLGVLGGILAAPATS